MASTFTPHTIPGAGGWGSDVIFTLILGFAVIALATWLGKFPPPGMSLPIRLAIVTLGILSLIAVGWVLNH